jgi:cytochrome P450
MSERVPYVDPLDSLPHARADELPLVTSFHDVQEIFTSKSFGQAGHDDSWDFIGGTLVTINGEKHKERLRIVRPLFTRDALVAYETAALIPAVERALGALEPEADGWIHTDLVQLGRRMLTQIAAAIIGLDDVESPERTDRLARYSERLAAASRLKFAVGDLDALRKEYLVDKAGFVEDFVEGSRRRREALIADVRAGKASEDALQADLLTTLLLHDRSTRRLPHRHVGERAPGGPREAGRSRVPSPGDVRVDAAACIVAAPDPALARACRPERGPLPGGHRRRGVCRGSES